MTFDANRVRKIASSSAVSPPPTTAMGRPLKKKPSHVAQVDVPLGERARIDGAEVELQPVGDRADEDLPGEGEAGAAEQEGGTSKRR